MPGTEAMMVAWWRRIKVGQTSGSRGPVLTMEVAPLAKGSKSPVPRV